jgi:hypothetical protein
MKRQQVYLLLGAALILAIAGTVFQMVRSAGWKGQAADLEPFAQLPVNNVEKIVIKSKKGTLTLQKANDIWTVVERNGYPADFSKIRDLIRSLWEFKVVRQLKVGPSQFGRLNILTPGQGDNSGVELDLIDAGGKPIKTLILGKSLTSEDEESEAPASGNGRFVYDPSEKDKVYLGKESFYTVDPTPRNWIDKDFIKPDGIKEVMRGASANTDGWKISRKDEKAPWELVDAKPGETLNTETVAGLANFSPNFEDVKPPDAPDSETGLKQPVTVDLVTFDGFKYTLEIGSPGPEQSHFVRLKVAADLPAARKADPNESPDDKKKKDEEFGKQQETLKTRLAEEQKLQKWVFQVQDWSLEAFLKGRKDILKAPSPTPSPSPAASAGVAPQPETPPPSLPSPTPRPNSPSPTPTVSPNSAAASPSPETSATPEATPSAEAVPSASPSPSATPEA